MEPNESPIANRKTNAIIIALLVAACLLVYLQVVSFDFINFDDNLYVYENPFVAGGLSAASLKWAFTAFHSANWHPLTWISHMLDASVFGPNAGGHHFVNVIFHAANSVLAFVVLKRYTGEIGMSALVAFLFAVHPAHVESVAWISERKDVLSTLFWLLTMLLYLRFVKTDGSKKSASGRWFTVSFLLVIVFFVFGLMSKPMLVTLPFAFLLLDYWPLKRLKRRADLAPLVLEKIPLFALSAASAYITIRAQGAYGAIQSSTVLPLGTRLMNAITSYATYIGMLFYPADLGIGYTYRYTISTWQIIGSIALLLAITVACIWQARQRKYLIVGWLWFVGTMVPVIGLVQVGAQSMADRYTYVPYFGLFVMVVWGASEFVPRLKINAASTAVVAAIPIIALTIAAYNQTAHWKDGVTLYTHTLNAGQGNFLTMHNLCSALARQNRFEEAEIQCRNSIAADPGFPESHILLGVISLRFGRSDEAISEFRRAIEIDPENAMAHGNLAAPLAMTGKTDEAEQSLNTAVDLYRRKGVNPASLANSYANLASAFARQQRFDKAAASLKKVLEFAPDKADSRANYALALYLQGKLSDARLEIDRAIKQNPEQAESHNILGMIMLKQSDTAGAVTHFERALQLRPDYKEAKDNLDKARSGTR